MYYDDEDYYDEDEEEEEEEDVIGSLIGIAAGAFLGLAGVALLDSLLGYRCPYCNKRIPKNARRCDHCHNYVRWE